MITYVTTDRATYTTILKDLAKYWTMRMTGTNASEVAWDKVQSARARGTAKYRHVGMRAWRAKSA